MANCRGAFLLEILIKHIMMYYFLHNEGNIYVTSCFVLFNVCSIFLIQHPNVARLEDPPPTEGVTCHYMIRLSVTSIYVTFLWQPLVGICL